MKCQILKSISFFISLLLATSINAQEFNSDVSSILVSYEKGCMQKMEYQSDADYIVEANYTIYQSKIDDQNRVFFKVVEGSEMENLQLNNYDVMDCSSFSTISRGLAKRVNTRATDMYIVEEVNGEEVLKKVFAVGLIKEDQALGTINYYNPSHLSFVYNKEEDHFPAKELYTTVEEEYDVRVYFHGEGEVAGHDKLEILKMYNQVCGSRPFVVTTPRSFGANPVQTTTNAKAGKVVLRSCQHPIVAHYVEGLGFIKEEYTENGLVYTSKLNTIDGINTEAYLSMTADGRELPVFATQEEEKPVDYNYNFDNGEDENYFAMKGATQKEAAPVKIESGQSEPSTTIVEGRKVYVVREGDTLYSLSRLFKTTVDEIRELNGLENDRIDVQQELVMPR